VVEEGYVSLVRLNPHVRKVIPFALRRWRKGLGDAAVRAEIAPSSATLRAEKNTTMCSTPRA
jgi:heptosyltransferase-1